MQGVSSSYAIETRADKKRSKNIICTTEMKILGGHVNVEEPGIFTWVKWLEEG